MQRHLLIIATCLIATCLLSLTSCRSGFDSGDRLTWTTPDQHVALQRGNYVSGSYYPCICPCVPDFYIFNRDRTKVTTFAELQTLLRPIDSKETALAYRELLGDVHLDRGPLLKRLQRSSDIEFHDGERAFFGVYTKTEQERWGIGTERVIEVLADRIVITGPTFSQDMTQDEATQEWTIGVARVELTRETIHRGGSYEREVLSVLEEGKSAELHRPAPLL